ncbi:MAG: MFS transporter [Spirochaetes bacterium]|nr:MFS transporter [Spirochaetota bacterium]
MALKPRIALMQFLQFLAWGSWLITAGVYCLSARGWSASQFGAIYSTTGIAALFMPTLAGIAADRWISAERLYGALHLACAAGMCCVPLVGDPSALFWLMLLNMCCYMPTISLVFSISYTVMEGAGMDIISEYPPLRVFGTAGFAAGMWTTSLAGLEASAWQFYISAAASAAVGLFAFTMPKCPPLGRRAGASWIQALGLDAFRLFGTYRMAVFFLFSMLLGVCMQLSNAYAGSYIHDFGRLPQYAGSLPIRYPAVIVSLGQMSEMCFILVILFVLRRFGIRRVMMMSMAAWVLRWLLLAYGDPAGRFPLLVLSMIVWGVAFDFFNVSGSLFVETQVDPSIRSSAQGLFQFMVIGVGAVAGSYASGWLIDARFTRGGVKDWHGILLAFAAYSAAVAVLFALLFRKPRDPGELAAFTGHAAEREESA